jgi:hypothetical protein
MLNNDKCCVENLIGVGKVVVAMEYSLYMMVRQEVIDKTNLNPDLKLKEQVCI